jgi:hypothetical protein
MDGRVQLPVITYLMKRLGADYLDSITEAGPVKVLAEQTDPVLLDSIFKRIAISTATHGSQTIALCAHADCAGNPLDEPTQKDQLKKATRFLQGKYPTATILMLWLDRNWNVYEL